MSELSLTILAETPDDADAIERLTERTFGPGRYAKTAYRLREAGPHALALSFTALIGTLLVGDEPYYGRAGFKRVPAGSAVMPGPVDPDRLLVAELVPGAFDGVSGLIRPEWGE